MSRKMTPVLLAVFLLVCVVVYMTEKSSTTTPASTQASRVLEIDPADILQVRMDRDYWNSYTLQREPDGSWRLTEPATEPAVMPAVNRLLETLAVLPIVRTIDVPSAHAERDAEYGLLKPSLEITVVTAARNHKLLFGSKTPDSKGTYCREEGQAAVLVTTTEAAGIIAADYKAYRSSATGGSSQAPGMPPLANPQTPNPQAAGGLKIENLSPGSGPAARAGQVVTVSYTGWLEDGTVFDSSAIQGWPLSFTLGRKEMIEGFDQGVTGMQVGAKRKLTIPPELAYGVRGKAPKVPPNATLTFEVELLSISDK